ncbi:hypothetical protein DY000_02053460 [Brassica cretica]|uniref:Uncharacterized protein n=1 Tax=Brassica cretica TaxID=69181 RepID=A0ABQ7AKS9_BRACR|nr:hypothetical protein DY000_02053460 [Brassica cretica]
MIRNCSVITLRDQVGAGITSTVDVCGIGEDGSGVVDGGGRIMWYQSHSEVWSSSQPSIRNSSSSKRSSVSFGLLKRNHEEKPTILNSSSSKRSPVFGLLINHEEEAAGKTQEEKLR